MNMDSLYLVVCLTFAAQSVSTQDRFLVSAPSVFHVGVKERVSVQLGKSLLNQPVTLYLENELGVLMSEKAGTRITAEGQIVTVELELMKDKVSSLNPTSGRPPYLNLVCEIRPGQRRMFRVLVSQHRGYIFIQTDQPIYNPTQKVQYRIFTLDHLMRPHKEQIFVSVINAGGNKIIRSHVESSNGIYSKSFPIPDVSAPGVWKIIAHYQGDEKNAAIREFKVQKFVLPSFGVSIKPQLSYYLVNEETFSFRIHASYSYGEDIKGAFHCRFGVKEEQTGETEGNKIVFIRGLEHAASLTNGTALVTVQKSDLIEKLKKLNLTLAHLAQRAQLYITVTVTDSISGEVQETEVSLPIVSQRYSVDLSRIRSHFIPGVPLDVPVVVRLPNGSPAPDVAVQIRVPQSLGESPNLRTNQEGTVYYPFNIPGKTQFVSVEVTVDGSKLEKRLPPASFPDNNFLYLNVINEVVPAGQPLSIEFRTINGQPEDGHIYYMVLSKGVLKKWDSVKSGELTKTTLTVHHDMTPSFRLIGYYYSQKGDIIADSVWVDVQDVCEGKISISSGSSMHRPGRMVKLNIDLGTQKAKVALLAVDKAIYSLNAQNKLTPKQVFSSMQSYDLGCSYGGGSDPANVFNDAGLSFVSNSEAVKSQMRMGFGCESGFRRQKRSIDLQQLMTTYAESNYRDEKLKECCRHGFTLIPMRLTCAERAERVRRSKKKDCEDAFLACCLEADKLRRKKKQEDALKGHARTVTAAEIEDFFDNTIQEIRRYFPPSFEFKEIEVNGTHTHFLATPDSITTWEIQAVSLSKSHGICVAEPFDLRVFKPLFISLRLPYSVKRYEQLSVVAVIYNYGDTLRKLSVHMKQEEGLCSPGSTTTSSYVNIDLEPSKSRIVTFSTVPMKTGEIPITIKLYDREFDYGVDAVEKMLLVKGEGAERREEQTHFITLDGRSDKNILIDGEFPNSTVPDSNTNLFVKIEGEVFGQATAQTLLSPDKVKNLLRIPSGCAEQTMLGMSPTVLSLRYLDLSNHWVELAPGTRDKALDYIDIGYERILTFKKGDGSYGAWTHYPTSNWLTGLVVKVMSVMAERQTASSGQKGRPDRVISEDNIQASVKYLIDQQNVDGSFSDPNPVIHREMQGGIGGIEKDASLTAFMTIALHHSLAFLTEEEKKTVEASISLATSYLLSRVGDLERPYAAALTAYCLAVCLKDRAGALPAWKKLQLLATKEGDCRVWRSNEGMRLVSEKNGFRVPPAMALTVETTAYALLTAVAHQDMEWADSAACFLSSQENYDGGFKSTQDTIVALEALSQYALSRPPLPDTKVNAQFSAPGRSQTEKLGLDKAGDRVETDLKRLLGNNINVKISGVGKAKMKVVKTYYALEPEVSCEELSISVTVHGKVEYTEEVVENYNYYDEGDGAGKGERGEEEDVPRSGIEWFDARSRHRRDTEQSLDSQNAVEYHVCVSHEEGRNLSGMAIADITLLSGFVAQTDDLDKLKDLADKYISHYEISHGRVLLYFNEIIGKECIKFDAIQKVPIGLVQPAQATFYDYYEPDRKCSVFYSAPRRSRMVSTLCSGDVCQCAERPCYKEKKTFEMKIKKLERFSHACYQPTVEYGYKVHVDSVTVKSNFELYHATVKEILRATGDESVEIGSVRVFAKRQQCKEQLTLGKQYLIMGRDGSTTDSSGQMQYLLDAQTWVEELLDQSKCKTAQRRYCKEFKDFLSEYQMNGCTQ